jgi:hypothetical protein
MGGRAAQIHTTADIYSHVRLRMQRHAIESMNQALQPDTDTEDEHRDDIDG